MIFNNETCNFYYYYKVINWRNDAFVYFINKMFYVAVLVIYAQEIYKSTKVWSTLGEFFFHAKRIHCDIFIAKSRHHFHLAHREKHFQVSVLYNNSKGIEANYAFPTSYENKNKNCLVEIGLNQFL